MGDYPTTDTGVKPENQGPNEQSIVASGMTVEEWKEKHPGQELGPAPEDIGQMTTDPVDGSELSEEDSVKAAGLAFPAPPPVVEESDADAGETPLDVSELSTPDSYENLTTHAQLNDYVQRHGIETPTGWNGMTVADKKAWLDTEEV